MSTHAIATIKDNQNLIGLRLYISEDGSTIDVPIEHITKVCKRIQSEFGKPAIENVCVNNMGEIVGTNGSIDRLTCFNKNLLIINKPALVIIGKIADKGYLVSDSYGVCRPVRTQSLIKLTAKFNIANGKVVRREDGTIFISSISGEYQEVDIIEKDKLLGTDKNDSAISRVGNSATVEYESSKSVPKLIVKNSHDVDWDKTDSFGKDVSSKIALTAGNLRKICPYYGSMYMSIPKMATTAVPTAGVTEDRYYFNPEFIQTLSISEFTFVLIHEMLHLTFAHPFRRGNKDPQLFNIACDLYINELICKEFGCKPYGGEVSVTSKLGGTGVIKCFDNGVFAENRELILDLEKDTVESIYIELLKENPSHNKTGQSNQGQGQSQQSQGQGQQGQSQQGQGQQGQGQSQQSQSQQGQSQQSQSQQGQSQQGQGQSGQGQQGQSQQGQGQQGQNGQGQQGSFGGKNVDNSSSDFDDALNNNGINDQKRDYTQGVDKELYYKGKKLSTKYSPSDIYTSNRNMSSSEKEGKYRRLVNKVETKVKMDGTSKSKGLGGSLVERYIDFALAPKIDWKKLLRKYAKQAEEDMYSMSNPERNRFSSGYYYPGIVDSDGGKKLKEIMICFDVSGSVGDKELKMYFTQCAKILKSYKVTARLIYWSTEIGNVIKFTNLKEMLKGKLYSTGGTEPLCLFKYLNKEVPFNGKYLDTEPSVVIIFTDGYIGEGYGEYKQKFGKKTLWVIDGGLRADYQPLFGKVADSVNRII